MFKKFFRLSRYRVVRAESYVVRKLFAEKIKVWLRANHSSQPKPEQKCGHSGKLCGRRWWLRFHRVTRIPRMQFQQNASGRDRKGQTQRIWRKNSKAGTMDARAWLTALPQGKREGSFAPGVSEGGARSNSSLFSSLGGWGQGGGGYSDLPRIHSISNYFKISV